MPHANPSKLRERRYEFASVKPFGLFVVLNRDEGLDETHGPERLAMLFVGGDGHATFDALYCQNDGTRAPFLVVVEDYGCGGNYDQFGEGGILACIARRCDVRPDWLLVGNRSTAWSGFRDSGAIPDLGGMHRHPRRLFLREDSSVWQRLNC